MLCTIPGVTRLVTLKMRQLAYNVTQVSTAAAIYIGRTVFFCESANFSLKMFTLKGKFRIFFQNFTDNAVLFTDSREVCLA